MFIRVNSSRRTAIGMLRFGVVYKVNEKDRKVKKAIEPLLDGKNAPLKRLTAKDVRKYKIEYLDLTGPKNEQAGLPAQSCEEDAITPSVNGD
ncbi:hypothetical protein PsAD2_04630 [Pseudovibrio axinellae]|uniref:Uncharacterized protein n=1 Tax=Pseudovibrio axinellae TaxID=989403 RepID=A0A165SVZ1_9HYPH|nr:hypothetical protein [Pseudovibrio axinellae]KZL04547.1 hypothetical protein PsAD2_04630 [Pseudovibrio axinellae]SEQ73528.1 hypothetical protein SAMN05421798_10478 [Pseudovibrio axinellae]